MCISLLGIEVAIEVGHIKQRLLHLQHLIVGFSQPLCTARALHPVDVPPPQPADGLDTDVSKVNACNNVYKLCYMGYEFIRQLHG